MTNRELGVLVVGHGTRDIAGQAQMRALACQTAGCLAPLKTDLGFLELAEPTIAHGIARLAKAGVTKLITVPVLLFRAGHADRDIPDAVKDAAADHGIQCLAQTSPLELQEAVIELSAQRYNEALSESACAVPPDSIAMALLARGSSSATAATTMCRFAQLRTERTPVSACRVGYVAIREPNVAQCLDWLARSTAAVLVVQPHLLFEGEVFHSLCQAVEERRQQDGRKWIICKPLGAPADDFDDLRLAQVLAQLVSGTLAQLSVQCHLPG